MIGKLVQCLVAPNERHRSFAGTIHTVRASQSGLAELLFGEAFLLDPPTVSGGQELSWHRDHLRVIGNPGDDAQDETLSWKPLPLPEIIPAMLDKETA